MRKVISDNTKILQYNVSERLKKHVEDRKKNGKYTVSSFYKDVLSAKAAPQKEIEISKDGHIETEIEPDDLSLERFKQWYYGNNPVDLKWVPAICEVMECDISFLFGESECRTKDIQGVVRFTGLSEKTVTELSDFTSKLDGKDAAFINAIVEKGYLQRLSWAYDEMTSYFQLYKTSAARHKILADFVSTEGILENDSYLLTDDSFMKTSDYQQFSFHKFLVYDLFMQFLTESENG